MRKRIFTMTAFLDMAVFHRGKLIDPATFSIQQKGDNEIIESINDVLNKKQTFILRVE